VQATGIIGTVFLGISAFWLSYRSLTHLAEMSSIADPWLWPLIVDGIIVVATVAAVAMAGRYGAWYPWLLLICGAVVSVTANAIQAAMTPDLAVPHALAATASSIPPIVLLAVTHLTVVLSRPAEFKPPKKRKHAAPPLPVEGTTHASVLPPVEDMQPALVQSRTPSFSEPTPPPVSTNNAAPAGTPVPPPVQREDLTPGLGAGQEVAGQASDDVQAPVDVKVNDAPAEEDIPGEEVAEGLDSMADDTLRALLADIRRDIEEPVRESSEPVGEQSRTWLMEQASVLKGEGLSNKQIGQRLGVDPTTVGRWLRQLANGTTNA
jgi:hypothetical protein